MMLILVLVFGTIGGVVAEYYRVPGGLICGSLIGSASIALLSSSEVTMPRPLKSGALIVVGCSIGILVTRSSLGRLGTVFIAAIIAGALIIVAGLGTTFILRWLGMAPPNDTLATSPGALSVMAAAAAEEGKGAVEVATFHLVRVVLVILSLPFIRSLLPPQ